MKKIIYSGVTLLIVFLFFETCAYVYLKLNNQSISWSEDFIEKADQSCRWADHTTPHPYIAFAYHSREKCKRRAANNFGSAGVEIPQFNSQDFFDVLILGGSVAEVFAEGDRPKKKWLENQLNQNLISPNGKPFRILNAALAGHKQPQQAIIYVLLQDIADAVISIDGFNEHWNMDSNLRLEYPEEVWISAINQRMSSLENLISQNLSYLPYILIKNSFLSYSNLFYLIANSFRVKTATTTKLKDSFKIPWFEKGSSLSKQEFLEFNLGQYHKYIKTIHFLAKANNQLSAFFLQPSPLYKKLSESENVLVKTRDYKELYDKMVRSFDLAQKRGINAFSLADLFKNERSTVFMDDIHFDYKKGDEVGNAQMANAIVNRLKQAWNLKVKSTKN